MVVKEAGTSDASPLADAVETIGDRWTLLIVATLLVSRLTPSTSPAP